MVMTLCLAAPRTNAEPGADAFVSQANGFVADAVWSTLPADGVGQPGVVYRNVNILAMDLSATQEDGGPRSREQRLFVNVTEYRVNEQGRMVPLVAVEAFEVPRTISFAVDPRLKFASVSGIVDVIECFPAGDYPLLPNLFVLCGSGDDPHYAGQAPVAATWTGGETFDHRTSRVSTSPCSTFNSHAADRFRFAEATGTFDGDDIDGESYAASTVIGAVHEADVFVEHWPSAPQPQSMCFAGS